MVSVPIRNVTLDSKDDVGVQYAAAIQQSHIIVEGKRCGELINRSVFGSTPRIVKISSGPYSSGIIYKREYVCRYIFPEVNIPPVRFIGGPTNQGRTCIIKGRLVPNYFVLL